MKVITIVYLSFMALIISLIVFSITANALACDDTVQPDTLPCDIITPVGLYCNNTYTYQITNLTSNTTLAQGNMSQNVDYSYNFTFNYSIGKYGIVICDNSSATINVAYDVGFQNYYIYIISFVLLALLIGWGFYIQNFVLLMLGGCLSVAIAVELYVIGFPFFDTVFLNWVSIVFAGIGFVFIVVPGVRWIQEQWGNI
jgi:hypothetical protein